MHPVRPARTARRSRNPTLQGSSLGPVAFSKRLEPPWTCPEALLPPELTMCVVLHQGTDDLARYTRLAGPAAEGALASAYND